MTQNKWISIITQNSYFIARCGNKRLLWQPFCIILSIYIGKCKNSFQSKPIYESCLKRITRNVYNKSTRSFHAVLKRRQNKSLHKTLTFQCAAGNGVNAVVTSAKFAVDIGRMSRSHAHTVRKYLLRLHFTLGNNLRPLQLSKSKHGMRPWKYKLNANLSHTTVGWKQITNKKMNRKS